MADESDKVGQDEIEQLLKSAQQGGGPGSSNDPAPSDDPAPLNNAVDSTPDDTPLKQDDIEALLQNAGVSVSQQANPSEAGGDSSTAGSPTSEIISNGDIDMLFAQASQALASVDQPVESAPPGIAPFQLQPLAGSPASTEQASFDLIQDVELDLRIELGRTLMYLEDVLQLRKGSVVPLDKLAGDPVDIYVNGRLIARGEVLVLNDNFCVRVAELIAGDKAA